MNIQPDNDKLKGAFVEIAERTRMRVQQVIAETAGEAGQLSEPETAALFWAQLSGVITAVGSGLEGLLRHGGPQGFNAAIMIDALQNQLESAFMQARAQRDAAND